MSWGLAELRTRWRIPAVLAVTLQSDRVAVDYVRRENGGSRVLRSASIPRGAAGVLEDPEGVGRDLGKLLHAEGIREQRCVVCVPAGWAMSTATDFPEIAGEDLPGFLELQAEREFPVSAGELLLAHSPYEVAGSNRRATVAGLPRRKVDAVRHMLGAAGCRPVSISLGLNPAWAEQSLGGYGGVNVLVNGDHVDLVVVTGGGIAALRSIPAPERSEKTPSSLGADRLGRELRITLGRLPSGVRAGLSKVRFIGPVESAAAVFDASQSVLHRLGLQGMVPAGSEPGAEKGGGAGSAVGVAAAERHLQGRPVLFEFVAPEITRWQLFLRRYDTRRHRWIAAAVLAGVVLPMLLMVLRARAEAGLAAEWKGMQATVTELETLQGKLRQFRPWFGSGSPSVSVLHALVSAFPEAGDVWAGRIVLKEDALVTCTGFARNQGVWMEFLDRLGGQPGVTELKVRSVRGEDPLQVDFSFVWNPRYEP
jgi:hypothetical protein